MDKSTQMRWGTARQDALIRLLDDPSTRVQRALFNAFVGMGVAAETLLRHVEKTADASLRPHATRFLVELGHEPSGDAFFRFINEFHYDLEGGSLLLSQVCYPNEDSNACYLQLDALAQRCRQLILHPASAWEQCLVINRVLFHEFGLHAAVSDFDHPDSSFLTRVLKKRSGLPVALCIVYLLVAERIGLELEPIAFPGHFLVGCFTEGEPFYIDAYARGAFLSLEDCEAILSAADLQPEPAYFAPATIAEVLQRCCRNLSSQYQKTSQPARATLFAHFVDAFDAALQRQS
jgi:regulator of sirC expression with transglutaminase-like and TPR domain